MEVPYVIAKFVTMKRIPFGGLKPVVNSPSPAKPPIRSDNEENPLRGIETGSWERGKEVWPRRVTMKRIPFGGLKRVADGVIQHAGPTV